MTHVWWLPVVAIVLLAVRGYRLATQAEDRAGNAAQPGQAAVPRPAERLEAKFVQLAAAHAAQAPRWADCTFADDVAYVRSRTTGELSAFVAVTMATEDRTRLPRPVGAVGNLQAGTAVFRFDRDHWETDGRAILNLSPNEAVHHYGDNWRSSARNSPIGRDATCRPPAPASRGPTLPLLLPDTAYNTSARRRCTNGRWPPRAASFGRLGLLDRRLGPRNDTLRRVLLDVRPASVRSR